MASYEEKVGKTLIRIVAEPSGGFAGVTIRDGKRGEIINDEDRDHLLARLRNAAGKLEPNYFGMDAAIARFRQFMPEGFAGEFIQRERGYKVKASAALNGVLPLDRARSASRADADAVRKAAVWINLLSPYESMHLKEAIEGPYGPGFLVGAARFASGDMAAGLAGMRQAMKHHGPFTWPIATYFPFLWCPALHMFLKPTVTRDFAERVGHPFQYQYSSDIEPETYQVLLELTADTRQALTALHPADNIDVQSFIWVVGGYSEAKMPLADEAGG